MCGKSEYQVASGLFLCAYFETHTHSGNLAHECFTCPSLDFDFFLLGLETLLIKYHAYNACSDWPKAMFGSGYPNTEIKNAFTGIFENMADVVIL